MPFGGVFSGTNPFVEDEDQKPVIPAVVPWVPVRTRGNGSAGDPVVVDPDVVERRRVRLHSPATYTAAAATVEHRREGWPTLMIRVNGTAPLDHLPDSVDLEERNARPAARWVFHERKPLDGWAALPTWSDRVDVGLQAHCVVLASFADNTKVAYNTEDLEAVPAADGIIVGEIGEHTERSPRTLSQQYIMAVEVPPARPTQAPTTYYRLTLDGMRHLGAQLILHESTPLGRLWAQMSQPNAKFIIGKHQVLFPSMFAPTDMALTAWQSAVQSFAVLDNLVKTPLQRDTAHLWPMIDHFVRQLIEGERIRRYPPRGWSSGATTHTLLAGIEVDKYNAYKALSDALNAYTTGRPVRR
jgi:hypothetical protein